jgi:hypothetical protein
MRARRIESTVAQRKLTLKALTLVALDLQLRFELKYECAVLELLRRSLLVSARFGAVRLKS